MREGFTQGLIDKQELMVFENMIDDRNNTSHGYDEIMSEKIAKRAFSHIDYIINTIERLENSQQIE